MINPSAAQDVRNNTCLPVLCADTVLNFIRNHPLMDEAVSHENGAPIFYKGDVAFSSLVVERLKIQGFPDDKHYTVYYAGTGTPLCTLFLLLFHLLSTVFCCLNSLDKYSI